MKIVKTDILIIGAGVLGCFAARALSRYDLSVTVVEKREDVCTGLSKSNMGIVYAGYDMKPGSLKAKMTVEGNRTFETLCRELSVPYKKTGSFMVSYGPKGDARLKKKYEDGLQNGVPDLKIVNGIFAEEKLPHLKKGISSALYSATTGIVNPWKLGIAAFENAKTNGVEFVFNEEVKQINCVKNKERENAAKQIFTYTNRTIFLSKAVINCGGVFSDVVRDKIYPCEGACDNSDSNDAKRFLSPNLKNEITSADYLVFDEGTAEFIDKVIFVESEDKKSSYQIVPSFNNNLIVGPSKETWNGSLDDGTTKEGIEKLFRFCRDILPDLSLEEVISQFGGLRPNPYNADHREEKLNDLVITEDYGVISLIGIKTPGITISEVLGKHVADSAIEIIKKSDENFCLIEKQNFNPIRKKPLYEACEDTDSIDNGVYVCRCRKVTEAMIRKAIEAGAVTVNGVRRRTGAGMGRCQGSYCEHQILRIVSEELKLPKEEVTKNGSGSEILKTGLYKRKKGNIHESC